MKIAIITETFLPSTDGVVTRLKESIKYLRKQEHEVVVIAPDFGVTEYEGAIVEGVKTTKMPFYRYREFSLPQRRVKELLQKHNPDLVHVVNPALVGVSGVYYADKLNYPLIASYHTHVPKYLDYYRLYPFKPLVWWYFRKLHNYADVNLCTSKAIKKELDEKNFHNVSVWDRGVAVDHYHPKHKNEAMRKRLTGGKTANKLLIFVGRLAPEKEIHKIRPLLERRNDLSLAIVGDGPVKKELEETFKGTNTIFTGLLHGEELAQAFASSDALIFPSVTETLGLVILESMASGLPVIAAKSGPTMEQVEDGKTGLLFENENTESMIQAIQRLEDEGLYRTLCENAREEAEKYSWQKPSEQILEYYYQTLKVYEEQTATTSKKSKLKVTE
ncbi:glycosyltransferase family 4 protein [Halobacillus karajensis]|uniref:GDP-mannose-dependent alpha-mannosyltransferase n=1 Tax=Halobacillus karajensis TaxID=195088 RepID=A0A024P2C7_9BACI|nr:glycosyltransferase family 1 protein [Halobacillus karajensis]CDQ19601.1 GDP-mannose-dependent alpha-mannosyltransferase [Halobacillus karajensis]CDQ22061.1 GDP-mannose-dependent alpha-mannosyltransferase [Halobacillus karajensis]CDQ27902.1 GDP-mannose-dependent alpha-mannosyltransferase [Halobacillus karajensis]